MKALLGVELPVDEVMEAYRRLRFAPIRKGDVIECTVPSARLDINIEADLIEEAIRVIGYGRVPVRDEISIRVTPPEPDAKALDLVRRTMIAAGYYEAITFSWASDELVGAFRPIEAAALLRADANIRKADAHLRPSILPGLIEAAARNQSVGNGQVKLFETGSVFWHDAAGEVVEKHMLAVLGSDDEHEVRGAVALAMAKLDRTREVKVLPADSPGMERGVAGEILWGGRTIGRIGRIDKAICDQLSLRGRPYGAEMNLASLIEGCQHVPQLMHLPRFPAVERDVSLIVAEGVRYAQIESLLMDEKLQDLEATRYVGTYRGKPLEAGLKSVTSTLVFRSATSTLMADEVEASVQKVIEAAKTKLGAALRA